jgi:hypothetical protein
MAAAVMGVCGLGFMGAAVEVVGQRRAVWAQRVVHRVLSIGGAPLSSRDVDATPLRRLVLAYADLIVTSLLFAETLLVGTLVTCAIERWSVSDGAFFSFVTACGIGACLWYSIGLPGLGSQCWRDRVDFSEVNRRQNTGSAVGVIDGVWQ